MRSCADLFGIYMKFPMFWNKKWASSVKYFWSYWLRQICLFKKITGLFSENPLAVNALSLTRCKSSWNLQKSTFILLFHHSEQYSVKKKSFLIRSEILGLLDNTLTADYKYSRSNSENLTLPIQIKLSRKSSTFCWIFGIYIKWQMFWYKNEPDRLSISEVIDSERCGYFNAEQGFFLKTLWQWTC